MVVVIVLAEVVAPSSGRMLPAWLHYLAMVQWGESSYDAYLTDESEQGSDPPQSHSQFMAALGRGTRLTEWLSVPDLWVTWLPVISASELPFVWVGSVLPPEPMFFTRGVGGVELIYKKEPDIRALLWSGSTCVRGPPHVIVGWRSKFRGTNLSLPLS